MKKVLSMAAVCLACTMQTMAQDIKVDYSKARSADLSKMMRVMEVDNFNLEITGEFTNKKILLVKHYVAGKRIVKSKTTMVDNANSNTLKVEIWTRKLDANRVKIDVYSNTFQWSTEEELKNNQTYVLMETKKDGLTLNEIPLFAFTSGIKKKVSEGGRTLDTVDYVSLRDSNASPSGWGERFNLPPYIYYSIEVE